MAADGGVGGEGEAIILDDNKAASLLDSVPPSYYNSRQRGGYNPAV